MRHVVWFSCGSASAVALKIAVETLPNVVAVYCDTGGEHVDNKRFLADVQDWTGKQITVLRNEEYTDHLDVCYKRNYWSNLRGAPCTVELKRKLREDYQRPGDVHIFGYTADERVRAARFEMRQPGIKVDWVLIRCGITKQQTLAIICEAGIELPYMYKLGYTHNNCIGCVKGSMGYFNKIRRDFPIQFLRIAELERKMGKSILLDHNKPLYLDELDPERGRDTEVEDTTCDIFCHELFRRYNMY